MDFLIQSAYADPTGAGAAAPSIISQILLPVAFFAIFYFLIIRPQSKRNKEHQAMINALKEGDEVIFAGGLMGRIKKLEGAYAVIDLNDKTSIKVQRAAVISVLPNGTMESLDG